MTEESGSESARAALPPAAVDAFLSHFIIGVRFNTGEQAGRLLTFSLPAAVQTVVRSDPFIPRETGERASFRMPAACTLADQITREDFLVAPPGFFSSEHEQVWLQILNLDAPGDTARYLDIWLMRRTVNYIRVGYSSINYTMWALCRDIRGKATPELVDVLTEKLARDDVTLEGSPTRGRGGIAELGLNQFSRRYIYHLLARLTAFVEVGSGKPDLFDKYVDRHQRNPCDIEHIWANHYERYKDECSSVACLK